VATCPESRTGAFQDSFASSKLEIEKFFFSSPFGFQANENISRKLSFGTPFKNFSPALTP
jgi:hypothetical protein